MDIRAEQRAQQVTQVTMSEVEVTQQVANLEMMRDKGWLQHDEVGDPHLDYPFGKELPADVCRLDGAADKTQFTALYCCHTP